MDVTKEMIIDHIDRNMHKWMSGYIRNRHINRPRSGLRTKLGTYGDDYRRITYAATFTDMTDGEDISEVIYTALRAHADEILSWVRNGSATTLTLFCRDYPSEVAGITCSIFRHERLERADGYILILNKHGRNLFWLINAYPIRTGSDDLD